MGIDQIGKKGPPLAPQAGGVEGKAQTEAGRPFEVSATSAARAPAQSAALEATRTPLDRLRAGEIDAHGYLDLKVDEATSHLAGLPTQELSTIRQALRERMASDPTLVGLVGTATNRAPDPPTG